MNSIEGIAASFMPLLHSLLSMRLRAVSVTVYERVLDAFFGLQTLIPGMRTCGLREGF